MRELLDEWSIKEAHRFKLVYCIGSRWANVHFGAKTAHHEEPTPPTGFAELGKAEMVSAGLNDELLLYTYI
jgi:hypothetical protein